MRELYFETLVPGHYKEVFSQFDEELFLALKPPLMPLKLLRFDGSRKKDEIHLELGPFKSRWISLIISDCESETEMSFVDKGVTLPFPLIFWEHHHKVIKKNDQQSLIIDHIYFSSGHTMIDLFLHPLLKFQFGLRDSAYKKFFKVT